MARPEDLEPIPKAPLWLGTAGLFPFVALTSALWALSEAYAQTLLFWLTAYGAIVLSFIGALHWGFAMLHPAMTEQDRSVFMTWSVIPALVGWVCMLVPVKTALLLLIASFAIQYAADRQFVQRFPLPSWYLRLRGGLTAIVVLCLLLAFARLAHL